MIKAIDAHTHINTPEWRGVDVFREQKRRFPTSVAEEPVEAMARNYRELEMKAIVLPFDKERSLGEPYLGNDYVAELIRPYPDVFIGFMGVDPLGGKRAVREVERCVADLELRGLKFVPPVQDFYPSDRRVYPIYEKCAELRIPIIFHTGHSGNGAGLPGGGGIHLKYGQPIYLDDVAADFPELTIVAAHPGWPWHEELLSIVLHKANVFMDLSGYLPRYIPESVIRYADTLLQDKVMFGSDYPVMTPQRWLDDFAKSPIRPEVRKKILLENARRVYKIDV